MSGDREFLVGTYTSPHGGGTGVHRLRLASGRLEGGAPAAEVASPSFLARHPSEPVVYAVAEHTGNVVVLAERGGDLVVIQSGVAAGPAVCHIRVEPAGAALVATCWGDGTVLRYPLDARGRILGRTTAPAASYPHRRSGQISRAHASLALGPDADAGFVTTDLGFDLIRRWRTVDGALIETGRVVLPEGSGPRHLVAAHGAIHVVTEYSNEVVSIREDGGELAIVARVPVRVGGRRDGDTAAEIAIAPNGRWLTVGVRGSDVIAALGFEPDGSVRPVGEAPAGGARPRFHLHVDDGILVAAQQDSRVALLAFDDRTGAIGPVADAITVPSPTHLLPLG